MQVTQKARTAPAGYTGKLFLNPAEVAAELRISTSTVLRLIHAQKLPAIAVSERIYRIPAASFEMFKAGTLPSLDEPGLAPLGPIEPGSAPDLVEGEPLPSGMRAGGTMPWQPPKRGR